MESQLWDQPFASVSPSVCWVNLKGRWVLWVLHPAHSANVAPGRIYVCVSRSVGFNSLRPQDLCPPVSSVHGILQARMLKWVAISSSWGSSQPGSPAWKMDALLPEPPGKPRRREDKRHNTLESWDVAVMKRGGLWKSQPQAWSALSTPAQTAPS